MDCVVVGELEEVQVLLPIILSAVNKSPKTFDDCSIGAFDLSIPLGVIRTRVYHFGSQCGKDVLPETRGKLRALVREKPVREPVVAEHVLDKKTGGFLGGQLLRTRRKPQHLGELVHEHQDTCIRIGR